MEQLNYQAQQFEGIVPVLDVGDPSESLASAYQYTGADQTAILNRMREDQQIEQRNLDQKIKGFEDIMKFSQTAVKQANEMKNQQTKQEAAAVWAEAYNNFEAPDQKELANSYTKLEKEAVDASTDVETTLSKNLNKKEVVTVEDSARAAKVRKRTGLMGVVQANAQASAAMESYGPALQTWMSKANAKKAEQGGGMIEPGEEYNRVKGEFDRLWAEKTGMAMANPAYTAKNVYPKLRREAASQADTYTRSFNVQEAAITTESNLQKLQDGNMSVNDFFISQKGLVGRDGKTLRNNSDVWSTLAQANLSPDKLSTLGTETNPATGKAYNKHPRWSTLQIDARKRRSEQYNLGRAEQSRTSLEGFNSSDGTAEGNLAIRDQQLAAGMSADIVNKNFSAAMARTDRKVEVQAATARINNMLDNRGPDYKLTAADMDGVPNELWNTFAGRLGKNANNEHRENTMRESDRFKEIDKDLDATLSSIDNKVKLANAAMGVPGAVNLNTFKQDAMTEIVKRAGFIQLEQEGMSDDDALDAAKEQWVADQRKLHAEGKFYDRKKNEFLTAPGAVQRVADKNQQWQRIRETTEDNLETGLLESDYLPPLEGQRYSQRVFALGQQFGKTPSAIVAMARRQKGLPDLELTARDKALADIPPSNMAQIAALGDRTPFQMIQRAQINSGQTLQGTDEERTISVGRQLQEMGYGGIWQHPDFHYDTGYAKGAGTADGFTPTRKNKGSYHNSNKSLDIGLQANGPQRLEQLYQYLLKNKERFGVAELIYAPKGSGRYDPDGSHWHHVHVAFD
jgi:hypothetical protein